MAFKATYNWPPFGRDDRVVMILSAGGFAWM